MSDRVALQSWIDALGGQRGVVRLTDREYVCDGPIDMKRAVLRGTGTPGVSGGGGTIVRFTEGGFFSSIPDNRGFQIHDLAIYGESFNAPQNGQVLVDFTGQNNPAMTNVILDGAEVGMRLANGASIECHYGTFHGVSVNRCHRGAEIASLANSHQWFGGRWWSNSTAVWIDAANNISFHGVAFEAHRTAGIDSGGANVSTFGCRFEANASMVPNLTKHGTPGHHYCFGDHWSTGIDPVDTAFYTGPPVSGFISGQLLTPT